MTFSKPKTSRSLYTDGKRAKKNYETTKKKIRNFYVYLCKMIDSGTKVPPIRLQGTRKECPTEYLSEYKKDHFPRITSNEYITIRKYIEENPKLWSNFLASRRVKKQRKKILKESDMLAIENRKLKDEISALTRLRPHLYYIESADRISVKMTDIIQTRIKQMGHSPSKKDIAQICEFVICELISSEFMKNALRSNLNHPLETQLNSYLKALISQID